MPFGRGKTLLASSHGILGGWHLSGIYRFWSGEPLSFSVPGATLGNGFGPNLVGNPRLSDLTAARWFNQDAFEPPPRTVFGNSGIGLIDGPGLHLLDFGLMKNFHFTEDKYLQFRWEMFNMPNHVNYDNPVTTIRLPATGQIHLGQRCPTDAVCPEVHLLTEGRLARSSVRPRYRKRSQLSAAGGHQRMMPRLV